MKRFYFKQPVQGEDLIEGWRDWHKGRYPRKSFQIFVEAVGRERVVFGTSGYIQSLRYLSKERCSYSKSSLPEVFCKKGVLRNFGKFSGKHLPESHFHLQLYSKEILARVFSCEYLWWLLLLFFASGRLGVNFTFSRSDPVMYGEHQSRQLCGQYLP